MEEQQSNGRGNKSAQAPCYIESCPFCGGAGEKIEIDTGNCAWIYYIRCKKCYISGPEVGVDSRKNLEQHLKGASKALRLWNNRA